MKLVTVDEMKAIEAEASATGLSYSQMMENAGKGLADYISTHFATINPKAVLGLVGVGNNGGDTLIALTHLAALGWKTYAYLLKPRPNRDDLINRLQSEGGEIWTSDADVNFSTLDNLLGNVGLILDGILGTGFNLPLRPEISEVLRSVNRKIFELEAIPKIVAVDCPSGVDSTTGDAADECLHADITLCLAAVKVGLIKQPASKFVGDIRWVDIGISNGLESWKNIEIDIVDKNMVQGLLPPRPNDAHKGTFGTALVIAGSTNYTGAALLAGKGAYRAGAGLVTLAVPAPLHLALAGHFPEATWLLLPNEQGVISVDGVDLVKKNLGKVTAILLGPGWGMEHTTGQFLTRFFQSGKVRNTRKIGFVSQDIENQQTDPLLLPALVVDADAIKLLKGIDNWYKLIPKHTILTPHPGEMSILTELPIEEIQKDRISIAKHYAREWGHVIVLKGANTVIAGPEGEAAVVMVANAGLARAGSGDVLAGVIAGLSAQGVPPYQAACVGTWIHAHAGISAVAQLGSSATVLAGDILDGIVNVFRSFRKD